MPQTPSPHGSRIVVGFENRRSSLAALRWGIGAAEAGGVPLVVVHATNAGVAVRNGPSSAIAYRLGGPLWASVYSLVHGLGAPSDTETIVETGKPADVLARHVGDNDVVVLGARGRLRVGRDLQRLLESRSNCSVVRVGESSLVTASPRVVQPNLVQA